MKKKLENQLVGVAGEYLVAGELTLRGFLAAITLRNSRGIDIIASNSDASKSISIQVKTNSNGSNQWILSKKSEDFFSDDHYYIFVAIKEIGERPNFHIVNSRIVAEFIKSSHRKWIAGKKKDGAPRKDSNMRKFIDEKNEFLEKWKFLNL